MALTANTINLKQQCHVFFGNAQTQTCTIQELLEIASRHTVLTGLILHLIQLKPVGGVGGGSHIKKSQTKI